MAATRVAIRTTTDSAWVSATDLMAGLMIVFMFIAIAFMKNVSNIAEEWVDTKAQIYEALLQEFRDDLPRWNAEIEGKTLTVRFKEPRVLFTKGKTGLSDRFRAILEDFFPRYAGVLHRFERDVSEIRIEGHTSSEWEGAGSEQDAYFRNMRLSQGRTEEVLIFSLSQVPAKEDCYSWTCEKLVASGFSSSHLVYSPGTRVEDKNASRRVEFRVRTNAEERLSSILGGSDEDDR